MLDVLSHTVYRRLFAAQLIALLGTGLMTIALALLAHDLAGESAGAVLGTALTVKMIAYVGIAPVAGALVARLPRKGVMIGADLLRAGVALALPFASTPLQIYALVFLLQSASATFTPVFQALIPDVLPEEEDYTRALSLSRLAYEFENIFSPAIAGVLLLFLTFDSLFAGTVAGFVFSAWLVWRTVLPPQAKASDRPFRERLTRGTRIYLATPRLRGLLALNGAAAAVGAFVLVNSVVIVRDGLGGDESALALVMAAYGAGAAAAAVALPRLLDHGWDRSIMLTAAALLGVSALAAGIWTQWAGLPGWPLLIGLWTGFGLMSSAVLTPSGRLLRRSAHAEDRPAVFTAQFALSHACWLVAYPFAGWGGASLGLGPALACAGLAAMALVGVALRVWPADSGGAIVHSHANLPPDHPHLLAHGLGGTHRHPIVIDDEHRVWPSHG